MSWRMPFLRSRRGNRRLPRILLYLAVVLDFLRYTVDIELSPMRESKASMPLHSVATLPQMRASQVSNYELALKK